MIINKLQSTTLAALAGLCILQNALAAEKPNFIVIFTDDQGYADLSCFGSDKIKTPHIDQLAAEGMKLTSFYVASPVCTPSRAALLTGAYPKRIEMHRHVLFPSAKVGMNPEEVTIADMLKANGYATAAVGKWHLGDNPKFLPTRQGFDYYFGIPYSNDMNHPKNQDKPKKAWDRGWLNQDEIMPEWNTPLIEGEEIIELPVNQRTITRRYTDKTIEFAAANKDKPFFVYLAHSMPHIPLFVPEDRYDGNLENAYTCVIEHIDDEVGRLVAELKKQGQYDNTYILFTSDNGPWTQFKHHAGSAKPLSGSKGNTKEGGQRVPFVIKGPGIPAGSSSDAIVSSIDILPTIAKLAKVEAKTRGKIDGLDASVLLTGKGESPRNEFLYFSSMGEIEGIRVGDWKFRKFGKNAKCTLHNLAQDIGEANDLIKQHPDKAAELEARMLELNEEITTNQRKRGTLEKN